LLYTDPTCTIFPEWHMLLNLSDVPGNY